jgi:hypothetical protein
MNTPALSDGQSDNDCAGKRLLKCVSPCVIALAKHFTPVGSDITAILFQTMR